MPQLPTMTVVMPCDTLGSMSGVRITLVSSWVWTSMKPGASTRPSPSVSSSPSQAVESEVAMAAMRPSAMATSNSVDSGSWPLPSTMRTLRMTLSYCCISISQRLTVAAAAMRIEYVLDAPQQLLAAIGLLQRDFGGQQVDHHHHCVAR